MFKIRGGEGEICSSAQAPLLPGTQAADIFLFCSSYKMSERSQKY